MKKLIFLLVIVFLLSSMSAFAGNAILGARASGLLGWFSGSDWRDGLDSIGADNGVRFGYLIGFYLEIPIIDVLAIQPEILLSSKGGAYSYDIGFNVKGRVSATGLEFPLYLKPKFQAGDGIFYLLVGPDFYLIFGDLTYKESGGGMTVKIDVTPDNSFVVGFSGGIGYTYPLGIGNLDIALKYDKSITKVFEDDNTSFNGVGVTVGYTIPILK